MKVEESPHSVPNSIDAVYRVLARCASGRKLLKEFELVQERFEISVKPYPQELRKRLHEANPAEPVGAAVVWDLDRATLYFDPFSPLGFLVPFVAHELAHCLDFRLMRQLMAPARRQDQKAQTLFLTERRAFDWQFLVISELEVVWPELKEFLRGELAQTWALKKRPTDAEICAHYGFDHHQVLAA